MGEEFRVRIRDDSLCFSAAHFITCGGACEPLHGHNFAVGVEVAGPLDENHCVVDFIALKKILVELLGQLDHRVLLPTRHEALRLEIRDLEVEAVFSGRRWVFPRAECVLLPLANTTAELLARHIARDLRNRLAELRGEVDWEVAVEVMESPGFSAVCRLGGEAG